MQTKQDYKIWTGWCSRSGLSEEELMRLDIVDSVLTDYAKEHPNVFGVDNLDEWVLMPKSTSEIIAELQPVMHLDHPDVFMWLRSRSYQLKQDTSEQLQWQMYERRYIDD